MSSRGETMQFKTLIILTAAATLIACSSTQEKQEPTLIQEDSRPTLIQKGFSLLLPDQEEWTVVKNNHYKVIMTKLGSVNGERYTIQALVVKLPNFKSDEDFMRYISNRMEKSQKGSQVEVLEQNVQLVDGQDGKCVQYNSKEQYSGKSKPALLEIANYTCRHTSKENAGVYIAYSKKYTKGNADKNFRTTAAGLFGHMELAEF